MRPAGAGLRWVAVPGACLGMIAACGGEGTTATPQLSVRDSAGVRIVEYPGEVPSERVITRQGEPDLVIGREGDPDYEFFGAADVEALSDGRIVVANGGTPDLAVYGLDGTFQARIGGPGEGPDEFGSIQAIGRTAGDTLWVDDGARLRMVRVAPAGTVIDGVSWAEDVEPPGSDSPTLFCGPTDAAGLLAGERKVLWAQLCFELLGREGSRSVGGSIVVVRGARRDTLGEYTRFALWEFGSGGSGWTPVPLAPEARIALAGERIHITSGTRFEVRTFDADGRLVEIRREDRPVPEATPDVRSALEEAWTEMEMEELPGAIAVPAYDGLIAADDGSLWARSFVVPGEERQRWTVFPPSPEGERRGVSLPAGVEIHAVRDGRAYGIRADELGIQQVVVYDVGALWEE